MCKMLCKILFFLLKINEYCYNYRSCDANDHKRKDRSIISSLNCSYRIPLTVCFTLVSRVRSTVLIFRCGCLNRCIIRRSGCCITCIICGTARCTAGICGSCCCRLRSRCRGRSCTGRIASIFNFFSYKCLASCNSKRAERVCTEYHCTALNTWHDCFHSTTVQKMLNCIIISGLNRNCHTQIFTIWDLILCIVFQIP